MSRRYLLISPCRDEAEFVGTTIEAVAAQTVLPAKWLIVDDGSKDETPRILAEAARRHPFIQVVRREDRGQRSVGPGVIDAFYHGLAQVDPGEYDYLCKFDCDLDLGPRYFERTMEHFERDEWLGTLSGKLYLKHGDKFIPERTGDENSVGPVKFYRRVCFEDIGGFVREVCWDGIDGHMCRMHGWVASSVDEPELRIKHLRQMGSSHISLWTGRKRWGRGKYFMGTMPAYMAAVALYRMLERPYVVGGLGILWGYVTARWAGAPRMSDPGYLAYLRSYEWRALLLGKGRTASRYHQQIRQKAPKTLGVPSFFPPSAMAGR